jgi:hypothetical protein
LNTEFDFDSKEEISAFVFVGIEKFEFDCNSNVPVRDMLLFSAISKNI